MEYIATICQTSQEAIEKVNQACYDNCAYIWDRFPFPNVIPGFVQKHWDAKLGNRVLDVGSGTGILAKWLSDQGFDVFCIDPSPEMVKRCKEKGLNTLCSTVQNYNPDGQFSMIFAILSLIHVPKRDFASQIKKLADALPSGGILFLAMLEGHGEGVFEGPEYPRFFAYYTPEDILTKVDSFFVLKDFYSVKSDKIGYMLFVLGKKPKGSLKPMSSQ